VAPAELTISKCGLACCSGWPPAGANPAARIVEAIMKLGTRIKRIKKVDGERQEVFLEYSDGLTCMVNLRFLFENPRGRPLILEILRGNLFERCFVESGALAWPNGYELCPDALRAWAEEQRKQSAA
jgi:hypothetical protein